MKLIELIYPQNRIVSIVGTSKNAGKTVTLNEIISQAGEQNINLGLISTGRDGERRDVLTDTEKPPIFARRGTIIATVENVLESSKEGYAGLEILSVSNHHTPMGRVILCRVMKDGYVEISGPNSTATIREMCHEMLGLGVELILIDGSLDRRASAAPYVSDGTILATGAALARSMNTVIAKTSYIIKGYSVQKLEEQFEALARGILEEAGTAIVQKNGEVRLIPTETTLQCGALISEQLDENTALIILSGSATSDSIKTILQNKKSSFRIVVRDATRIFIPAADYKLLCKMGMELRVLDKVNIIALTVNPYSPEGYYFDAAEFLTKMREHSAAIPVFDVVQGG